MIIKPKIKGFVCITSHPKGCFANVKQQMEYAQSNPISVSKAPKRVLIIGSSTGYGLSSRVAAAFGTNADTLGVFFERPPKEEKPASAGYYNTLAFQTLGLPTLGFPTLGSPTLGFPNPWLPLPLAGPTLKGK